jgi:uncharacterized membrane protein YhaH (DUF805 family)
MHWYFQVLKKYAVFSGRARRVEYWTFLLVNVGVLILLNLVDAAAGTMTPNGGAGVFTSLFALATLLPGIAVFVRRMHDTNRSGWWALLALTGIGGIVLFVFALLDSDPGDNQYGPNPKAAEVGPTPATPPTVQRPVAQTFASNPPPVAAPQTPANGGGDVSAANPSAVPPPKPGLLATCPFCGAAGQGAKFCRECGHTLQVKNRCPQCGAEYKDLTNSCPECGTPLQTKRACAACGASLDSDSRFCRECGASVA